MKTFVSYLPIALACAYSLFGQLSHAQTTIMPIGDSITVGIDYYTSTVGGYRDPLCQDLTASDMYFQFVGVNNNANNFGSSTPALTSANQDSHNGFGGYQIIDIYNNLDGSVSAVGSNTGNQGGYWLTGGSGTGRGAVSPDIILLQIGTNDILQGVSLSLIETRLNSLVNKIHALTPHSVVLVAGIPPINSSSLSSTVSTYNAYIRQSLVPSLSYTKYVDNYSDFLRSDGSINASLLGADNVHPNRYGYPILALKWAAAIRSFAAISPGTFPLTVNGGSGSGSYPAGTVVSIAADPTSDGSQQFVNWSPANSALDNPYGSNATFVMPAAPVTLSPNYASSGAPLMPNGTYQIVGAPATFQFPWVNGLSMGAASTSNSSLVQQQLYSGVATQQWDLTNLGNNVVELSLTGTGRALSVKGGSTSNGGYLDVEDYAGSANQQWTIVPLFGTTEIVNVNSGLAVNIPGYSTATGAGLVQSTAGFADNQLWSFYPVLSSASQVVAPSTYSLSVSSGTGSGSYAAGSSVTISANQPPSGSTFAGWTGDTNTVANAMAQTTTLKMPAAATSLTATYSVSAMSVVSDGGGPSITSGTIYQDGFSRSNDLLGSVPDVVATGGGTWLYTSGSGQYLTNGRTLSPNAAGYSFSAAFLPVNGKSGVVLDGTRDFVLSVVVTPGSIGLTGISLSTGLVKDSYGTLLTGSVATLETGGSFIGAYAFGGGYLNYDYRPGIAGPTTIALTYSAPAHTITYTVGSTVLYTQTGVTATQIAAIKAVALGNDGYGAGASAPAPTFDNFTLVISQATVANSGSSAIAPAPTYSLTVEGGTGSGSYTAGTSVAVNANVPSAGYQFAGWTGDTSTLSSASTAATVLEMPAATTKVTATYVSIPSVTKTSSVLIPDGLYQIAAQSSGLSMATASSVERTPAAQQTYSASAFQQWTLTNLGNNVVMLMLVGTSEALEVNQASKLAGANIDLATYTGAPNQQWTIVSTSNGYYELVNVNSTLELNVSGNSMSSGATLCQWFTGAYANGLWAFTPVSGSVTNTSEVTKDAKDIDLTDYTLTFDDEFTNLSLTNTSPKGTSTWFGLPPNGAPGYFSSSQWDSSSFGVSNGVLASKAFLDSSGKWHSGYMASIDSTGAGFSQLYGYFEIRAQMPDSGNGSWPSFWLTGRDSINQSGNNNSEIDVFEWYGVSHDNSPGIIQQASHNYNSDGTGPVGLYSPQTQLPDGSQPWAGYHIYGVKIDPTYITWFIDGVQTNQIGTPTSYLTSPFYMMVDYALGGGWPLSGVVNNSKLNVDWVRVYALPVVASSTPSPSPTPIVVAAGNSLGTFTLLNQSASTGNALALPYHGSMEGEPLGLFWNSSSSSTFESFSVVSMGNSQYKLVETSGGRCVSVLGSTVSVKTCSDSGSQLFSIVPQSNGSYALRSATADSCLSAPGAFSSVSASSCSGLSDQMWTFAGSISLALDNK